MITEQYYASLFNKFHGELMKIWLNWMKGKNFFHHDNAPAHMSKQIWRNDLVKTFTSNMDVIAEINSYFTEVGWSVSELNQTIYIYLKKLNFVKKNNLSFQSQWLKTALACSVTYHAHIFKCSVTYIVFARCKMYYL